MQGYSAYCVAYGCAGECTDWSDLTKLQEVNMYNPYCNVYMFLISEKNASNMLLDKSLQGICTGMCSFYQSSLL